MIEIWQEEKQNSFARMANTRRSQETTFGNGGNLFVLMTESSWSLIRFRSWPN